MNKLDTKTRAQILHLLCQGQLIRAITRVVSMSKNTVAKLLSDSGAVCAAYEDEALQPDQQTGAGRRDLKPYHANAYASLHPPYQWFLKEGGSHANAVALPFMYYNFVRIHKTLRVTPAMAAGVTDKLWEISDIVALIEAKEAERRWCAGPYKRRGNPAVA